MHRETWNDAQCKQNRSDVNRRTTQCIISMCNDSAMLI